jgi:copper chaperone CopZ
MHVERITLAISDLGWNGAGALTIERALVHVEGVLSVHGNGATEMAYVVFDRDRLEPDRLFTAIERTGFHAARLGR